MTFQAFRFDPVELPPAAKALRREVRAFLDENRASLGNRRDYDQAFSRKMAERGWIGMTWPKQYGGHERTAFERYVLIEEMLAAGAPSASTGPPIGRAVRTSCVTAPTSRRTTSCPASRAASCRSASA